MKFLYSAAAFFSRLAARGTRGKKPAAKIIFIDSPEPGKEKFLSRLQGLEEFMSRAVHRYPADAAGSLPGTLMPKQKGKVFNIRKMSGISGVNIFIAGAAACYACFSLFSSLNILLQGFGTDKMIRTSLHRLPDVDYIQNDMIAGVKANLAGQAPGKSSLSQSAGEKSEARISGQVLAETVFVQNTDDIIKLLDSRLSEYLAIGSFKGEKGEKGDRGEQGLPGMPEIVPQGGLVRNSEAIQTAVIGGAPIVSYVQPNQSSGFSGASVAGFTTLSATNFSAGSVTVTGTISASAFSGDGSGLTGISGGSGSGSVATGTAGSFAYYETSSAAVSPQSTLYFSGARIGIGSSSPIAALSITGTSSLPSSSLLAIASSSGASFFAIASNGSTTINSLGTGFVRSASGSLYTDTATYLQSSDLSGYVQYSYGSSTYVNYGYGSSTYATQADLLSYPTFTYGSSTYVGFGYATNTFATIASYPTYSYASSAYATTWGLLAGSNITITTSTPGQITISSTGGSGSSAWTLGSGLIYNATSTDLVGIGTSSPIAKLHIDTTSSTLPLLRVSTSTSQSIFNIAASGNVGIGTTSPVGRLSVTDSSGTGKFTVLTDGRVAVNANNASVSGAKLFLGNLGFNEGLVLSASQAAGGYTGSFMRNYDGVGTSMLVGSNRHMIFETGKTDYGETTTGNRALTLFNTGIASFGTATPLSSLHIQAYASSTLNAFSVASSSGSSVMVVSPKGYAGIGTTSPAAPLHIFNTAATPLILERSADTANVSIEFKDQTTSWFAGKGSGGDFNINTDANLGGAPKLALTTGGALTVASCTGCSSDARLKTAVEELPQNSLEMLAKLRPVSYNWAGPVFGVNMPTSTQFGFLAQEVSEIFPNLIYKDSATALTPGGTYLLNYQGLIAPIVSAIKQLDERTKVASALQGGSEGVLSGDIVLDAHLRLSEDSVGQAKILPGFLEVRVDFIRPYEYQPIITATPLNFIDGPYRIKNEDALGFSIELKHTQSEEVTFNWHAFASEKAKLTASGGLKLDIVLIIPQDEVPASERDFKAVEIPPAEEAIKSGEVEISEAKEPGQNFDADVVAADDVTVLVSEEDAKEPAEEEEIQEIDAPIQAALPEASEIALDAETEPAGDVGE